MPSYPLTLPDILAMASSNNDPVKDFYDGAAVINSPDSGLSGPDATE